MERDSSEMSCPSTTAPNGMAFSTAPMLQNQFEDWSNENHGAHVQHHLNYFPIDHVSYPMSTQPYMAAAFQQPDLSYSAVHSAPQPNTVPRYQPEAGLMHPSPSPSQLYTSGTYHYQTYPTSNVLMPVDGNILSRPKSTDTQVDSTNSSTSRPSSNHSSPATRTPKFKVPQITTQFGRQGQTGNLANTPPDDMFRITSGPDGITALSSAWLHGHEGDYQMSDDLNSGEIKEPPALMAPFKPDSPETRRTSISSQASGPVFSPYGTPASVMWQQSTFSSPYPPQSWTPRSNRGYFSGSPQSPNQSRSARNHGSWRIRPGLETLYQKKGLKPDSSSVPSRGKPRMGRNVSDGNTSAPRSSHSTSRARSMDPRARTTAEDSERSFSMITNQMALPEYNFNALFATPGMPQGEFGEQLQPLMGTQTPSGQMRPYHPANTPRLVVDYSPAQNVTPEFQNPGFFAPHGSCQLDHDHHDHHDRNYDVSTITSNPSAPISTPAHYPPLPVPSEPPLSDFLLDPTVSPTTTTAQGQSHAPASGPIRQSPQFEGDIYTPRYKRRNASGKWEGWCGYCQPGRWLDLKNSRYWEDKLRNHGICARTRTFFDGPVRVRWVSDRGTVWEGEGDPNMDDGSGLGIDDDGVGRKREGLCGECNNWVGMDGMRSRGKGRCVAWWMHAYKCHEQSKSKIESAHD